VVAPVPTRSTLTATAASRRHRSPFPPCSAAPTLTRLWAAGRSALTDGTLSQAQFQYYMLQVRCASCPPPRGAAVTDTGSFTPFLWGRVARDGPLSRAAPSPRPQLGLARAMPSRQDGALSEVTEARLSWTVSSGLRFHPGVQNVFLPLCGAWSGAASLSAVPTGVHLASIPFARAPCRTRYT